MILYIFHLLFCFKNSKNELYFQEFSSISNNPKNQKLYSRINNFFQGTQIFSNFHVRKKIPFSNTNICVEIWDFLISVLFLENLCTLDTVIRKMNGNHRLYEIIGNLDF